MTTRLDVQDPAVIARLRSVAEEAARAAGAVALGGFGGALEITSKGGSDIVTQYDHAAEDAALAAVRNHFPDATFLAEESGDSNASAEGGVVWLIDPIDGTHNFAYQLPFWCVSVGVAERNSGDVLAGVVYDAQHGELFSAGRGLGATLNGHRISVTTTAKLKLAIVAYDIGHSGDVSRRMVKLVAAVQPRVGKVRHLGSAALSITYVAAGRIDAYYHLSLNAWDVAAAILLVREAGGVITEWDGSERKAVAGGAVAANAALHPLLLSLLHDADSD